MPEPTPADLPPAPLPELEVIDRYYRERPDPYIVPSARISHNIFCSLDEDERIRYTWSTEGGEFTEKNNRAVSKDELKHYVTPEVFEIISRDIEEKW